MSDARASTSIVYRGVQSGRLLSIEWPVDHGGRQGTRSARFGASALGWRSSGRSRQRRRGAPPRRRRRCRRTRLPRSPGCARRTSGCAWSATFYKSRSRSLPEPGHELPLHRGSSRCLSGAADVRCARGLGGRLLRLAWASAERTRNHQYRAPGCDPTGPSGQRWPLWQPAGPCRAAGGRIAPQFTRDCRGSPTETAPNLLYGMALHLEKCDLLALYQ
ncbi:hypothetical protein ABIF30_009387 [Bradyrhizobium elkanii]